MQLPLFVLAFLKKNLTIWMILKKLSLPLKQLKKKTKFFMLFQIIQKKLNLDERQ